MELIRLLPLQPTVVSRDLVWFTWWQGWRQPSQRWIYQSRRKTFFFLIVIPRIISTITTNWTRYYSDIIQWQFQSVLTTLKSWLHSPSFILLSNLFFFLFHFLPYLLVFPSIFSFLYLSPPLPLSYSTSSSFFSIFSVVHGSSYHDTQKLLHLENSFCC